MTTANCRSFRKPEMYLNSARLGGSASYFSAARFLRASISTQMGGVQRNAVWRIVP